MMNSQKTAETVARIAQSAAQNLLKVQARFTEAFAAGELVMPSTMQDLIEAQKATHVTAGLERRWSRGGMQAIEDWMVDAADQLIEGSYGGTSSALQNEAERAERKALQAAYKALSRCRD